jgi:monoamine oxidase
MAYFLPIDENSHNRKASPYEVLTSLTTEDSELQPFITTTEGPLHFAGDHTSVKPSWIEGAVESGVRAALDVHTA